MHILYMKENMNMSSIYPVSKNKWFQYSEKLLKYDMKLDWCYTKLTISTLLSNLLLINVLFH